MVLSSYDHPLVAVVWSVRFYLPMIEIFQSRRTPSTQSPLGSRAARCRARSCVVQARDRSEAARLSARCDRTCHGAISRSLLAHPRRRASASSAALGGPGDPDRRITLHRNQMPFRGTPAAMDDIVAARVKDCSGKWYSFMTWGRIVDRIDESWVVEAVRSFARTCAIDGIAELQVCESLYEVMNCQYFHEGLFHFANAGIPFGRSYDAWREARLEEFKRGHPEVFFLGSDFG